MTETSCIPVLDIRADGDYDICNTCGARAKAGTLIIHSNTCAYLCRNNKRAYAIKDQEGEDIINHPRHYTSHPSGVECIQITEHMGFNLGNALKYIWRADLKHNAIEDLEKAKWYLEREIALRNKKNLPEPTVG